MTNDFASKPRKQEKYYRWGFWILLIIVIAGIAINYFGRGWIGLLGIVGIIAYVILSTAFKERPWEYTDFLKRCKELEFSYSHQRLDDSPDSCIVVEHGSRWRAHFFLPIPVTYGADPLRKVVISREQMTPYDIIRLTEKSEALRTVAAASVARRQQASAVEQLGIDTGEVEAVNDDE